MIKLLLIIVHCSLIFSQFNWRENGLPFRQGEHIEWQRTGDIASDGSLIISWSDTRNGIRDLYAQKIDSQGNYLWGADGAIVSDFGGRQEDPLLVSDDAGGVYIIWRDYRNENYYGDIYGQHLDENGNRVWDSDGIPISNQSGEQSSHNLCIDGNGGAFAVWVDKNGAGTYRGSHLTPNQSDISSIGDGALISSQQSGGFSLEYAGSSEAVMVWTDYSTDGDSDLRAQRFNSDMELLWNEDGSFNGKVICDAENNQQKSKVTTFNDNKVIVVWRDLRNDPDGDVYAQIFDNQGNELLESNGVVVCDDSGQQASPRVKTDGSHAFIYWEDKRNNNVDPYVQKMDISGNLIWLENGVQLADDSEDQDQLRMSVDNNGGAFFAWVDGRGDSNPEWAGSDIYANHIDMDGSVLFNNGLEIDMNSGPQEFPLIKCNADGEAYIVWNDRKDGSNIIIEFQKITTSGTHFDQNGKEVWYGVDGNALLSSSLYISEGKTLVSWEDNRYLSSGHPGSFTYGVIVEEDFTIDSNEGSVPLSLNPFQGPHGGNYNYRAKLSSVSDNIMMNFHQYNGPYRQYIQLLDSELNIIGDDQGIPVDENGEDQKYSDICTMGENFYLAYSSLNMAYGIFLAKYDDNGFPVWNNPVNIVEGDLADALVKAIIANPLETGVIVIFESASFMGVELTAIFMDQDGSVLNEISVCEDCQNPQFESYAVGDNEFIVTYKSSSSELASGVYSQIFSFDGNLLGSVDGEIISDVQNDQRSSDITYNSVLDEYLVCWSDGRDTYTNDSGDEVADVNILCSVFSFDSEIVVSDEIAVAAIEGSQQQSPTVFAAGNGSYLVAWEDMRSAEGIDQSLNLSFEWDAYYQEINYQGLVYQEGGIPLSTAPFGQINIQFGTLSEDENLYLAFWEDDRSTGKELLTNIYGQLISPYEEAECIYMDLNSDGTIDIFDVIHIINIVLENSSPDAWELCSADANQDGNIDVLDIVATVEYILN